MNRRNFCAGLAVLSTVAACGGVPLYQDQGPANVTVRLVGADSTVWAQREIWVGVYAGPPGAETYQGSRRITGSTQIGVPVGQSVNLVLAFEESRLIGGSSSSQSVVHGLGVVPSGAAWRVDVSYAAEGFSWDVIRLR